MASIEELLERVATAMEKNASLLEKIVSGKPGASVSGEAGAADKPKRQTAADKKKAAETEGSGDGDGDVDADDLKATVKKLAGWVKEFAEDEEDPENDARNEALAEVLGKLKVKKASEITTEKDRSRFEKWLDGKIEEGRTTKKKGGKKVEEDDGDGDL